VIFGLAFPDGYGVASFEDKQEALRVVIYGFTAVTAATGVFVWFVVSDGHPPDEPDLEEWKPHTESVWTHILRVLRIPAVWLNAIIILCAYVGYKGFDNYGLFAVQGYGIDEITAGQIVAVGAWMRPIGALGAGLLGDRFNASRMIVIVFALLLASHLFFALTTPIPGLVWVVFSNTLLGALMIYGLRSLYFALFDRGREGPAGRNRDRGRVCFCDRFYARYFCGVCGRYPA
jgi:nitrate/nitrite transporter NarK